MSNTNYLSSFFIVDSKKLKSSIYIVEQSDKFFIPNPNYPVYTKKEIEILTKKNLSDEEVIKINEIKKIFNRAVIIDDI